jgi:hypothetical protein
MDDADGNGDENMVKQEMEVTDVPEGKVIVPPTQPHPHICPLILRALTSLAGCMTRSTLQNLTIQTGITDGERGGRQQKPKPIPEATEERSG